MSRNMLNGAQVIVDYLIQEKVPQVFGLCGHGNIQFIDALYERSSDIKTISVHHESVAGFMADVYYRVSGRPTATFTSCGPGSANLPISLANAFLDSVPFLAVTGNVPTSQFNRGAFQEMYRHYQADFPSTVRTMCKKVFQPTRGEMVPLAVRQAWKTMTTGRPGPVVLDVPFDVFMESAAEEAPNAQAWNANISSRCGADPEGVVKAVDMLLGAERPMIIVGQGVRYGGAADELLKLAERLQIPVAASASGLGAIDCNHPLALGLVARAGHYQANHATRQADVLLAMGMRFDDRTSSSWIPGYSFTIPPTRLIHVDIDPEEIGRNYPVALGLMADVRTFLRQVHAELDRRADLTKKADARKKWLAQIDTYRKEWDKFVAPGFSDDTTPINPQRAALEIDKALPEDAILVSDIGVHHNWLLGFCKPKRPDSLIGSMGFGPMGFGVAGVMGAKFAAPDRPCVSVCGDGAFFMHANVLGTAVEYNLPVVWVVWNNYAYASIRGLQRGYLGGRELATDFHDPNTGQRYNPDFAAMARSCGVEGVRVDRAGDLGEAIRKGIAANKPYLIDVDIAADINPVGAGVWELPGLGQSKAGIGTRFSPPDLLREEIACCLQARKSSSSVVPPASVLRPPNWRSAKAPTSSSRRATSSGSTRSAEKLNAIAIPADVTSDDSVAELFRRCGPVDHVVVTAAQLRTGPFKTVAMEDVRATMEGKFWGAWRVAQQADIRPGGSLTLVSGFLSVRPRPNSAIVSAANGALESLARALALELAPVRVNAVSPGIIDTPIRAAMPEEARRDMLAKTAAALPVGRVGAARISHARSSAS